MRIPHAFVRVHLNVTFLCNDILNAYGVATVFPTIGTYVTMCSSWPIVARPVRYWACRRSTVRRSNSASKAAPLGTSAFSPTTIHLETAATSRKKAWENHSLAHCGATNVSIQVLGTMITVRHDTALVEFACTVITIPRRCNS